MVRTNNSLKYDPLAKTSKSPLCMFFLALWATTYEVQNCLCVQFSSSRTMTSRRRPIAAICIVSPMMQVSQPPPTTSLREAARWTLWKAGRCQGGTAREPITVPPNESFSCTPIGDATPHLLTMHFTVMTPAPFVIGVFALLNDKGEGDGRGSSWWLLFIRKMNWEKKDLYILMCWQLSSGCIQDWFVCKPTSLPSLFSARVWLLSHKTNFIWIERPWFKFAFSQKGWVIPFAKSSHCHKFHINFYNL